MALSAVYSREQELTYSPEAVLVIVCHFTIVFILNALSKY
jgi:hypothetical protein